VRIAVWLKQLQSIGARCYLAVSIRRADRCLVEDAPSSAVRTLSGFQSAVRIAVWLKFVHLAGDLAAFQFQSAVRIAVWLKATGRSTSNAEDRPFQSAVRIAVWLKPTHRPPATRPH